MCAVSKGRRETAFFTLVLKFPKAPSHETVSNPLSLSGTSTTLFAQSIHDLIAADNQPTPAKLVDTAWEIANRSIEKMGFKFVYPMGAMVAPPPEESQPETQESDKATADADAKLD